LPAGWPVEVDVGIAHPGVLIFECAGPRPGLVRARPARDIRGWVLDALALGGALSLIMLGALNLRLVAGWSPTAHQLLAAAAGLALIVGVRRMPPRRLAAIGWACYGAGVLGCAAVLAVGVEVNGARRWLELGSVSVQPSEVAILALVVVLADVLGSDRPAWQRFMVAVGLAGVSIGLVAPEPDLSTTLLLAMLTVALLIAGRIPLRLVVPFVAAMALAAWAAVPLMRPYQIERLREFLGPSKAARGAGWAAHQAQIAIASGRLTGMAAGPARHLLAQYLPNRNDDLAFASLVEGRGLVAGVVALVAASIVVWCLAAAARTPRSRRGGLLAAGLAALFGIEVVVSVGGNLGVLPIAGAPFPLVSYGGTATVACLGGLGIVLAARRDGARRRLWAPPRWRMPRPRWLRAGAVIATGGLIGLLADAWSVQASGSGLRQAGELEVSRCLRVPAPRGIITDRKGVPLVANAPHDEIVAIPALAGRSPGAVEHLAALLGQPSEQMQQELRDDQRYAGVLSVRVAAVPPDVGRRVAAADLAGVLVMPYQERVYPYGGLLGPLLGFTGVATPADVRRWPGLPPGEVVGRAGIEEEYDPLLRGVDGEQCVYVDPAGKPVARGPHRDPLPGGNLRLSIDLGLQQQLTAALAEALSGPGDAPRGDLGAAVMLDPTSGQVLAMASLPSYDDSIYGPPVDDVALGQLAVLTGNPTLEHATQVIAPPGSTFKLVIAAADAVDAVFPPGDPIPTGGSFTLGDHTFASWRAFGPQDLPEAIGWSNDVYFYKLALALGPRRIYQVGSALGVGRATGVDLPGESSGYFGTPESVTRSGGQWYPGSTVILGIGQGALTVTPLQAARWAAAVATGELITPRLGLAVEPAVGEARFLAPPTRSALPFAATLGPVRQGMRQAVTDGTAAVLADLPVAVGAKTGTAEDPAAPNGAPDAWMLAVAPIDRPAVAVSCFVRGGGFGAETCGPAVAQSLGWFFDHQAAVLAAAPANAAPANAAPAAPPANGTR